jgi:hypothetical protein
MADHLITGQNLSTKNDHLNTGQSGFWMVTVHMIQIIVYLLKLDLFFKRIVDCSIHQIQPSMILGFIDKQNPGSNLNDWRYTLSVSFFYKQFLKWKKLSVTRFELQTPKCTKQAHRPILPRYLPLFEFDSKNA